MLDLLHKQVTLEPQLKWWGPLSPMPKCQDKSPHVIKMNKEYIEGIYRIYLGGGLSVLEALLNIYIMEVVEVHLEARHHSAIL